MLRVVLTACAIAFLGGFISDKSVLAQDNENRVYWAAKPIQCGPTDYALNKAIEGELVPLWAGYGWSHSVNYDQPLPVLITLHANLETGGWAMMETDSRGNETCILSDGQGLEFDSNKIMDIILSLGSQ